MFHYAKACRTVTKRRSKDRANEAKIDLLIIQRSDSDVYHLIKDMKYRNTNNKTVKGYLVIALFFTLVILQSCGTTKSKFSHTVVAPAAEGSVKVKKDNNGNFVIE